MLIDGDFFESLSDITFKDPYTGPITPTLDNIKCDKECPILFINSSRIMQLFHVIQQQPNKEFIVIGHNCDTTFYDNIISLIPNNVRKVWLQNYNGLETDNISSLPIGLERKRWFPEQRKQNIIVENMNSNTKRVNKIYMNFSTDTNPIRKEWFNFLKEKEFIDTEMIGNGGNYNNYVNKLKEYKFIISPPGNGIDCHRNWEALYLKCVPIIQRSNFTESMFGDMNVILVDSYTDITNELLGNYEYKSNVDKLSTDYWEKMIKVDVK
jgi:hypothetical protein